MLEEIVLGIVQGIAEWLPISSEGTIILIKANLFGSEENLQTMVKKALFLHLGTFFAALIYFRKDVLKLSKALFKYKTQSLENKKLISFLVVSTLISGVFGLTLLKIVNHITNFSDHTGKVITLLVGVLLLGTGFLEIQTSRKQKKGGSQKHLSDLTILDGIILGIVQGFAALPGFSRSGLTVSALLLRRFDKFYALKLSFLMSLPIVLGGNIILNLTELHFSFLSLVGLIFSFIFGLATIHLLLKMAQRIDFGIFMLIFGVVTILSTLY